MVWAGQGQSLMYDTPTLKTRDKTIKQNAQDERGIHLRPNSRLGSKTGPRYKAL